MTFAMAVFTKSSQILKLRSTTVVDWVNMVNMEIRIAISSSNPVTLLALELIAD